MPRAKRELSTAPEPEPFWEPEPEFDSFDRPEEKTDLDRHLEYMDSLWLKNKKPPREPSSVGSLVAKVFSSIERLCLSQSVAVAQTFDGLSYRDYLKTEHWQKTRQIALKLGKHECKVCCSKKHLDVHHRTYERKGCERQEDLVVLCRSCHKIFHKHGRLASKE